MDSKNFFNAIKNNNIRFSEVKNKQNEFLKKLNNIMKYDEIIVRFTDQNIQSLEIGDRINLTMVIK